MFPMDTVERIPASLTRPDGVGLGEALLAEPPESGPREPPVQPPYSAWNPEPWPENPSTPARLLRSGSPPLAPEAGRCCTSDWKWGREMMPYVRITAARAMAETESGLAELPMLWPNHAMSFRIFSLVVGLMASLATPALTDRLTVAVATNFLTTAQDISDAFIAGTDHEVILVHGSTGKLYAQIVAGAPYDVFLSADVERPARLVSEGLLSDDSPKPYAIGRLAFVHIDPGLNSPLDVILARDGLRTAIADPAVAPYGGAARSVIRSIRGATWDRDIVFGESVAQAFAFVATGNADIGLVALSLARAHSGRIEFREVPESLHEPIRQDAALLARSETSLAARAFFEFLDSAASTRIIQAAGYGVPQ